MGVATSWSLVTLYPYTNMGSFPQDAVLPQLILHGLPAGCSSSRTAPTSLCTMEPIFQELLHMYPHRFPAILPQCGLLSMGCSSCLGLLPQVLYMGSIFFGAHLLLSCSLLHGCTWRSALYLEHLLPSSFTDIDVCRTVSLHFLLPALVQHVLLFLNLAKAQTVLSVLALASDRSPLGLIETGSFLTLNSFWTLLTKATPVAPCYQNVATWDKHTE